MLLEIVSEEGERKRPVTLKKKKDLGIIHRAVCRFKEMDHMVNCSISSAVFLNCDHKRWQTHQRVSDIRVALIKPHIINS